MNEFGRRSTAEQVTAGLDLRGRTALVTGCNSGIGFETMRVLALRGAHVIGAARTLDKARAACGAVTGSTTPVVCELSDFDSVRACVAAVQAGGEPLDMLICNAGIMALPRLQQRYGLELQFVTNHLGHFLLATRLRDQLAAARAGRVVLVSSLAHQFARSAGIEFDDLSGQQRYRPWRAYGQSKLANILFAKTLNRRLQATNARANALHPGAISTGLGRHQGRVFSTLFNRVAPRLLKSVEQGAATTCYVATRPELDAVGGAYFADCAEATCSPQARDAELGRRLWEFSEAFVEAH
ncbi:MAG TPA: SDR family oxidoreductase [Pseudomonadales bacterium]|nr:SDR family oxidoreductase [Pseudomonadales bacterium]